MASIELQHPEGMATTPKRRLVTTLLFVVSIGFAFGVAWLVRVPMASGNSDFAASYVAGKIVSSGNGAHLYDRETQIEVQDRFLINGGHNGYIAYAHGPFESLLFVPLAKLSYVKAVWIWWTCALTFALLSLYFLLPFVPRVADQLDLAFVALGFFYPLLRAECQGQDSSLSLLILVFSFVSLMRGREWQAGAALALITYKPPLVLPIIATLVLTSPRRGRILAGFSGTVVVLLLISIATVGWTGLLAYPHFLSEFAASPNEQYHVAEMPNLRGLLFSLFGSHLSPRALLLLLQGLSLICFAVSVWCVRLIGRQRHREPLQFALIVTTVVLVAYHEYAHDLTLLILPLLLVWNMTSNPDVPLKNRGLLAWSIPVMFIAPTLTIKQPQIYTCLIILFFGLLCWESVQDESGLAVASHRAATSL